MPANQNQAHKPTPQEIRHRLSERIVKNLHQVQEYLAELESQLQDPHYDHVVASLVEWQQRNRDLQQRVRELQGLWNKFNDELNLSDHDE